MVIVVVGCLQMFVVLIFQKKNNNIICHNSEVQFTIFIDLTEKLDIHTKLR